MKSKTLSNERIGQAPNYNKIAWGIVLGMASLLILYYLWTRGFVYFKYSKEVYTDYFWYRAPWLLVHVICGIVATLIGPFQFIARFRTRYPQLHRNMGKTYLGAIVISTFVSFYLVSTAQLGVAYATGLAMLGIVWLGTSLMAWASIVKGNVRMHREWMIKSYVLTLSFIGFRSVEDLLTKMNISNFVDRKILMAWACWAIPFFITELILQARRISIAQK
jgi:uncharacterized membrane protein